MGDAINCSLCGENHAPPDCATEAVERAILREVAKLADTTVVAYRTSTPFRHLCSLLCRQRKLATWAPRANHRRGDG